METLGQQLKAARERKGVTASQAAAATHLKVQHVEALEHDDYSRLTVPIYTKGFLKIYADYLGLDPAPLVREYTLRYAPRPAAAQPAPATTGKRALPAGFPFKLPRFSLPPMPAFPTLAPELRRRLAWGAGAVVVVVLLALAARRGCHRATVPPPPAPPPVIKPAVTHSQPAPWIIINEPPPPYYQRPAAPRSTP
jgi:transcriptional regulator with XRE-family HTH domain